MAARMTAPTPAPNARSAAVPPIPDEELLPELIEPLFPDVNGNGLDGEDIVHRLKVERAILDGLKSIADAQPSAANEAKIVAGIKTLRAHTIIFSINANTLAENLAAKGTCSPDELANVALELQYRLEALRRDNPVNPAISRSDQESIARTSMPADLDKINAAKWMTQKLALFDFSKSFGDTPKNIAIEPKNALEILELFTENPSSLGACRGPKASSTPLNQR